MSTYVSIISENSEAKHEKKETPSAYHSAPEVRFHVSSIGMILQCMILKDPDSEKAFMPTGLK